MSEKLVMRVKQGEEINIGMTVRAGTNPYNLNGYNIHFQVKRMPTVKSIPIIDKVITTDSNLNTVGKITYPEHGEFIVHLTKEDTAYPIDEYYLVISIVSEVEDNIISAPACSTATFEICEQ